MLLSSLRLRGVSLFRSQSQRRIPRIFLSSSSISKHTAMSDNHSSANALEGLEPERIWHFFGELSKIPRPSKHEEQVLAWLKQFADSRNLEWSQDSVGNIVIRRKGTGGGESALPVIVQGHVDMVTEKNSDKVHDFFKDPITLLREGDYITADGTTLGSDNGLGVCTALALLDLPPTATLPPLEALFTIDEETGLTGAFELDGSMLKGRTMLNLDSEEWPALFIGCAGGGDSSITIDIPTTIISPDTDTSLLEIGVTGLLGGHSGLNIHEGRGNAVIIAASVVDSLMNTVPGVFLQTLAGGDKRNAIPRECTAVLAVPKDSIRAVEEHVSRADENYRAEFGVLENGLRISCCQARDASSSSLAPLCVLTEEGSAALLTLLLTLPHGVVKMSHTVAGLTETSSNLAAIKPLDGGNDQKREFQVVCSTRSSLMPALERVRGNIRRIARLVGARVEQDEAYPGWVPDPHAEIVSIAKQALAEASGQDPEIKAIHAGLECGIIGEKIPGVQSVSFGPTIHGAHSPDERVQISTVKPFWEATLKIVHRLASVST